MLIKQCHTVVVGTEPIYVKFGMANPTGYPLPGPGYLRYFLWHIETTPLGFISEAPARTRTTQKTTAHSCEILGFMAK